MRCRREHGEPISPAPYLRAGSAAPSWTNSEITRAATKSGHVTVNGLNYYYQIHGKGQPLLLLHGGLGQIEMFGP